MYGQAPMQNALSKYICIKIFFVFSKSQINILLLLYSNKKNNKYNLFLDKGCHKQYKYCAFISNQPNTFTLQHTPHDQHGQGVFQYKGDTVFFIQSILRCSWPMLPMHAVILKVVRPLSGLNICLQRVTKNNNKTEHKKKANGNPFLHNGLA